MSLENRQLLRDKELAPTEEVLRVALGNNYQIFENFLRTVATDYQGEAQWRYYNDGKAWLCKVLCKEKTLMWVSVWENYFKVSLFFTQKTRDGVMALNISDSIKRSFSEVEMRGKLVALIMDVYDDELLDDLFKIIAYKRTLL